MKSKAEFIQFTDQQKGTKKVTWAIQKADEEKLKKVLEICNWTFHKRQYSKIPQIYTLPQFLSMSEKT